MTGTAPATAATGRYCVLCRFYRADNIAAECTAPQNMTDARDPVSGNLVRLARFCRTQRAGLVDDETRCGPAGRWFVAKGK